MPIGDVSLAAPASLPAVQALLAALGRSPEDPRLFVDPRDEMLGFLVDLHGGDREQALCVYYRSGASIAAVHLQVLRWRFGSAAAARSVLDFASGYGRVTRFLLDELPAAAITASDVLAEAMELQQRTFGVGAMPSSTSPEDLQLPGGFDAILVSSLFTHLPERRVSAWLGALLTRLARGGVLVFSTHDLSLLPAEQRPPAGCRFEPRSEIAGLATSDYGSTWMDEHFVRAALDATGLPHAAARFERALCNYQDLWVVVPDPAEAFTGLVLQTEPEVVLEECAFTHDGMVLSGWAAARQGSVVAVEALVDGTLIGSADVRQPRPDVAAVRGPAAAASGWSIRAARPASASVSDSALLLRAVDGRGERQVVWAGRPLTATLRARTLEAHRLREELYRARCERIEERAEAAREIAGLESRVTAMAASRFWKLRNAWFRLKRALRVTDEA